jgi:hypothetical protein
MPVSTPTDGDAEIATPPRPHRGRARETSVWEVTLAPNSNRRTRAGCDGVYRIICVLLALVGAIYAWLAWSKGFAATTPRIAIFTVVPLAFSVAGTLLFLAAPAVRKAGLVNATVCGLVLVAAEFYFLHETRSMISPEGSRVSPALSESDLDDVAPMLCPVNLVGEEDGVYAGRVLDDVGDPLLPLGGPSFARVAQVADKGIDTRTTDRHGFNNPDSAWDVSDRLDVLLIGDSFTFGADVPAGHGYADRVRDAIPGTVNLGCGGNGPLSALASLSEYGGALKPRVVVWGYYEGNDLTKDILREAATPLLARYLTEPDLAPQGLRDRQAEIDRALAPSIEAWRERSRRAAGSDPVVRRDASWLHVRPTDLATLYHLRSRLGLSQDFSPEALALAERTVARMVDIVASWGGRLVVLHIPSETRWLNPIAEMDAVEYTEKFKTAVERTGAAWVGIAPTFKAHAADPRSLYDGHFTADGYTLVGDTLVAWLKDFSR